MLSYVLGSVTFACRLCRIHSCEVRVRRGEMLFLSVSVPLPLSLTSLYSSPTSLLPFRLAGGRGLERHKFEETDSYRTKLAWAWAWTWTGGIPKGGGVGVLLPCFLSDKCAMTSVELRRV